MSPFKYDTESSQVPNLTWTDCCLFHLDTVLKFLSLSTAKEQKEINLSGLNYYADLFSFPELLRATGRLFDFEISPLNRGLFVSFLEEIEIPDV